MIPEVQRHGFAFERWICDTFFNNYKTISYTDEWDVSREFNTAYGGIPVSIKTAKYGSPVGLGDAQRQFQIKEPFLLIVGYWKQEDSKKRFVNIVAAPVTIDMWRSLWHPITFEDLQRLDTTIKNRALTYHQARVEAQRIKLQPPFTKAQIIMNPKIDSKAQRRLQCSLAFSTVFSKIACDADMSEVSEPQLFGVKALEAFLSNPRVFRNKSHSPE